MTNSEADLHILHAGAAPFSCVGDPLSQLLGAVSAIHMQMKALHLCDDEAAQSRVGRIQRVKLSKLAKRVIARSVVELLVGAEE